MSYAWRLGLPEGQKLRIEWIWVLPVGALVLVACDYGGVARLMWEMQPPARRRLWPGVTGFRVTAGILAIVTIVTRLIEPAGG
ncbi:hypothetical protein SUDANB105_07014 [Streptomyces sp. enrichment culture]